MSDDPFYTSKGPDSGSAHPPYLTEEEKLIDADYEWALHDPEVRRQYGGQVVAVHQRRVWGAGRNHGEAVRSAFSIPGCPDRRHLALVVVPDYIGSGQEDETRDDEGR